MLKPILLAIWHWLTPQVEEILDDEYAARLKKIRDDTAAVEAKEKQAADEARISEALYATSLARRNELNRLLAESEKTERELENELAEISKRVAGTRAQAEVAKGMVDALSDHDALRERL